MAIDQFSQCVRAYMVMYRKIFSIKQFVCLSTNTETINFYHYLRYTCTFYTPMILQNEPTGNRLECKYLKTELGDEPSVNVPIRRTARCVHIIPANDTKRNVLGHQTFPRLP